MGDAIQPSLAVVGDSSGSMATGAPKWRGKGVRLAGGRQVAR